MLFVASKVRYKTNGFVIVRAFCTGVESGGGI